MNLAENLQKLRKQAGLSQEELAEECQVSRQAVAKWESEESVPALEKLISLADFFGVTLDELVGYDDDFQLAAKFLKRYIAGNFKLGEEDESLSVAVRFFDFLEKYGVSAEDKVKGLKEVFLGEK